MDMRTKYLKYTMVMILLFLIGGFSIFLYLLQVYSAFWGSETFNLVRERRMLNESEQLNRPFNRERFIASFDPVAVLVSPFSVTILVIGLSCIIGGISIWNLTREKELKSVKEDISSLLLMPEEKTIIDELKKANGKISQRQLVRNTGFSKVKVHRVLSRLEMKKILKRYRYGLTNMIILEKTAL